jgi:hypothetical protein
LRLATAKQNAENRQGPDSGNASGYRGVSWQKQSKKWQGKVTHAGKCYYLGLHDSPLAAHERVKAKREELFTHSSN